MVGFVLSYLLCFWWFIGAFFVPRQKGHVLPMSAACLSPDGGGANSTSYGVLSTEAAHLGFTTWLDNATSAPGVTETDG